jgi:uncharacterized membrane protein HdeD (DUF308 family)
MTTTPPGTFSRAVGREAPGKTWQVAWACALIVAGVLAILMPAVAALATALVLAWLLIVAGGFEIAYAIHRRGRPGYGWKLASGVITLLLGIAILVVPAAGIASLALLVATFVLLGGITRGVLAWRLKPRRGWGWIMLDAVLSILIAILIAAGWPQSSLPIIGLLTGFTLVFAGIWRIFLSTLDAADGTAAGLPRPAAGVGPR